MGTLEPGLEAKIQEPWVPEWAKQWLLCYTSGTQGTDSQNRLEAARFQRCADLQASDQTSFNKAPGL